MSGLHPATLVLGTAPGGIAEMCITAKVLQLGVPLVTAFHVARVVVILLTTVPVFARVQQWWNAVKRMATTIATKGADSMPWNPAQYLQFAGERLRPALDLLARVPLERPADHRRLGMWCGQRDAAAGRALAGGADRRRRQFAVHAASKRARRRAMTRGITFVAADLAHWQPDAPVDLVYSNAALHWLPDHAALFARVAAMVAPGGVLAVQMPDNFRAPSHTLIADIARSERWRKQLAAIVREPPVAAAAAYFGWLAPLMTTVDIWLTEYLQVLAAAKRRRASGRGVDQGHVARARSSRRSMSRSARNSCATTCDSSRAHYPARPDGRTLFPFRRLFIVARRTGKAARPVRRWRSAE